MAHARTPQILVVEDESIVAKNVRNRLQGLGYGVLDLVSSGEEAIQKTAEMNPDLVLMDIRLKGALDGVQAAEQIRTRFDVPVIFLTAYANDQTLERAKITEPFGYILKPFQVKELHSAIEMALYRHEIAKKLRESERRLATILRSIGDAVIAVDTAAAIMFMNPVAETLTGWTQEEASGKDITDILQLLDEDTHDRIDNPVRLVMRAGDSVSQSSHKLLLTNNGTEVPIEDCATPLTDDAGNVVGSVWVFRDISARIKTEEALRIAQKMDSMGILASGVAHDFNNLLVAMLGQTSLALAKLPLDNPAHSNVEKAVRAAERASHLVQQMLLYSGGGELQSRLIQLDTLIREFRRLFEAAIPKSVRLRINLARSLPLIEGDMGQVQQVIMNLILNAIDAIGDEPGSIAVTTDTQQVSADDDELWRFTGEPLSAGRYVTLEVRDTGKGMDAQTLSRVFDPFFTTKSTGRGLGLAIVLGIVRRHKGGFQVQTRLGSGTKFKIFFPASATTFITPDTPPVTKPKKKLPASVLVIDDEEPVREVVVDILESEGMQVMTAPSGTLGIEIYRKRSHEIDLVLLDLSMPGLSGEQTLQELHRINADIRVILSSGYSQTEATRRFVGQGLAGFIHKPYDATTLVDEIVKHLNSD